ncbi:hypothetical protein JCM6882_004968 [Rhodosporidiobolus microsporus]
MPPHHNNGKKRAGEYASKPANKKLRKGAPPAADGGEAELDPVAQEKALKAYLHHAVKLLHKAVKKSKTFELQKLTRKLKTTREPKEGKADAAAVADLEAQLAAIKNLNLDAVPTHLLSTRLAKLPALRSTAFLPSLLSSIPPAPGKATFAELDPQSADGKARNRVLASKVVGEAWDEVVRAVRKRMGEEVDSKGGKGKGKEKEEPEKKKGIQMDPGRAAALEAALLKGGDDEAETDGDDSSADEGPAAGFSEGEEGDEDDEVERELARLNEGAGSEGEWSGSEDEDDDDGAAFSDEDDDAASDSSFPTTKTDKAASSKKRQPSLSPSPPPAKKSKAAAVSKPITSSSFLPSLAAGYVNYSDSDDEDARWVKDAEREDKKSARKNRRGQRARQAIWEKKFGSAANHVVKAAGGKAVPLAKMKEIKAKRAAAASGEGPAPRDERPAEPFDIKNARGGSANPNAQGLGAKARAFGGVAAAPEEKMHPSWEAKRKQKEALMNSAAIQPQGKKVVFD